ncbi:Rrf2 family transcriptional regulator [Cyanobium sp. BA20m-p-22]|uniref:Rrf2 family transcriptional regulator n=1 Tax=Cyanobium sp. BA20m-p-22 TaxID=2823704 RepID=UPI0020CB8DF3|nr:Rrf2 family transcriptional regulator [Cyanobium sp. BA20m-p-22]MCP9910615.1 Rrf2 family transcriptional regulator [Cyanobium sp. BA20m-p-22]
MLSKQANHALKALLELAAEPERWLSTHELAIAQQLPEPMLEQILLRLRRAGLLKARRGRLGGYRLAGAAGEMSIAAVLAAVDEDVDESEQKAGSSQSSPAEQVTFGLQRRLEQAQQRALEQLNLEELLFDLQSAVAGAEGGQGLLLG